MTISPRRDTFRTPCPLTRRQLEVLRWVAEGKSAIEIGIIMGLSRWTTTRHIEDAKRAAGVSKETALVATSLRQGWIT